MGIIFVLRRLKGENKSGGTNIIQKVDLGCYLVVAVVVVLVIEEEVVVGVVVVVEVVVLVVV